VKEIQLTKGMVAFVDDEDYERVNQFKWHAYFDGRYHWYTQRKVRLANGKWSTQDMHRFIMGLEPGDPRMVDHRDREQTLDNRRSNLRVATAAQNQQNAGLRKDSTSGFKGVSWETKSTKWRMQIMDRGKKIHGGYFNCKIAAAAAYNYLAKTLHGEFAVLNDLSNITVADLVQSTEAEMGVAAA
jgi:hypothetical protein